MQKRVNQKSIGKRLWLNALLATSILGLGMTVTPNTVHADDINTVQITSPDNSRTKDADLNATITTNNDGSQTIKVKLPANKVNGSDQKLNFVATDMDVDSDGSKDHQTVDSGTAQRKNNNIGFKVNVSSTALSNKTLMTDPLKITLLNSKGETIATIEGITLEELQDMAKNDTSDTSNMVVSTSGSTSTTSGRNPNSSSNAGSSDANAESKDISFSATSSMNPNGSTATSLANNTVTSTATQASSPATASSSTSTMPSMNPNGNSSTNSASSSTASTSSSSANSSSTPNSASSANESSSSPDSANSQSKDDQALPQTGNTNQFYLTIAGVAILAGVIGAYVGMKTRKK